jgi:hypothetical protein
MLRLGFYCDNPDGPGYLELEIAIAGDNHELDITRPPLDDVVRLKKIDHRKCERLGAVVARVSEGDR